jgi:glucose/arabinose dehydrogenase
MYEKKSQGRGGALRRVGILAAGLLGSLVATATDLPPDLSLELFADGFTRPIAVRNAGDGSGRLFVVEQAGRILVVEGGVVLTTAFLDISSVVDSTGNEQGLLGLAFHPDFSNNGLFFVNYTYDPGAGPDRTWVARYEVSATNPNQADLSSALEILDFAQNGSNHNAGDMHFGPDGYLYIAVGDGGGSRDPDALAQNLGSLLGSMLRIDIDGGLPYAVPVGNPFVGEGGAAPEIWSYGLRNPWRFSFDRLNGDIFIGDVGQGSREEVNRQPASSDGGENYGWSCMEGDLAVNYNPCDGSPLTAPILVYSHTPECSVTGGYLYRGNIGGLHGRYVFGDYCSGRIWFAVPDNGNWVAAEWADTTYAISSFGEDESGELYLTHLGGGEVYRFESPSSIFTDSFESGDVTEWGPTVGD